MLRLRGRVVSLPTRGRVKSIEVKHARTTLTALAPICATALLAVAADSPEEPIAGEPQGRREPAAWADFVETNFPFFSSVLDARKLGAGWPADNLTPRGLILNLGHGCWACFDTELIRISAIWSGPGVTSVAMSQGSYYLAGVK